jgi:aspartyl-tRNA(Asn)/glutamyl-tRNA(Gln) amidotransferase subunit B
MSNPEYEIVVGLEVHVQLKTQSKLFCRCSTQYGAPPNTQTCPVCLGMPGALPVMNRLAIELSLKTALALNCRIPESTKWDRKNYFYPDLPKGYQISQYDLPLSHDGYLAIQHPKGRFPAKRIGIIRAHLEDDAGKSMHDEAGRQSDSRIDLNRTGTPLLEIVSQPDLRSPLEAKAYLTELKLLLSYLDVSDCNMQEGSLRVDANINLHIPVADGPVPQHTSSQHTSPQQIVATPIVEVKNMNSFRAVERALAYEAERQYEVWLETGQKLGDVPKQTRGWDDQAQVTRGQRHKEESSDYRYFPDPDLVPVRIGREEVERIRRQLGELPAGLRERLETTYGLDPYDSDVLVNQGRALVQYYTAIADATGDGKRASNWIQQEVLRYLNEQGTTIENYPVPAPALSELLQAVAKGVLDNSRGKEVLQRMVESRCSAAQAMKELGIEQVDESAVRDLCRALLAANPHVVADVRGGKQQAVGALIGQARKQNPNANPAEVRRICLELIQQAEDIG